MRIWKISRTNEAAGKQLDLSGERCISDEKRLDTASKLYYNKKGEYYGSRNKDFSNLRRIIMKNALLV